jgi:hypothetical protein
MTRRHLGRRCLLLILLNASLGSSASALGTAFTYQGQLQQSGAPANGACDFQFSLWDVRGNGAPPTGGTQIGSTQTSTAVTVSNGVFTLPLDFGAAPFTSANDRWLQILVRCPGGSGAYQTLAPRQPLTPAPFALFATAIADGAVSTTKLAPGAVTASQLATNAVTAAQIADGSIATSDLANGAVNTAKIGDAQVTSAKLVAPLRLTSAVANTKIGALDGTSTGLNGVGVSGTANSGGDAVGVLGVANTGSGVTGDSSNGTGVTGYSRNGTGVYGEGVGDPGVWGESDLDGVFGVSTGSGDGVNGVAMQGAGVHGESLDGNGVFGEGKEAGVRGISQEGGGVAGIGPVGVGGLTIADDGIGVIGASLGSDDADGVGVSGTAKQGIGIRGSSDSGYAGFFEGPVLVAGVLTAGTKLFKIDHPLDPANRYLVHAAVESPEMKNIYDGVVVLDANGEAIVDLPPWFEALNRDFRYQLTCIGGVAPVYIADEVHDAQFRIAGGNAGLKVSWQVTGVRQDPFAVANPLVVEAEKAERERGRYLYPTAAGMPASMSLNRSRPAAMPLP